MMKISRLGICAAICCVGFMTVSSYGASPIKTYTKPCVDIVLSFVRLGKIAKIAVKDGDIVMPGQLLVQLDDSAEKAAVDRLAAKANQDLPIQEGKAKLDQAKLDLKKRVKHPNGVSAMEVEHARLTVVLSEIALAVARFEDGQNARTLKEAKVQLDLMKIKCPTSKYGSKGSGFRVEQVIRKVGESVDRLDEVVRIVKLDPLWLDVDVPMEDFLELGLTEGSKARVTFCGADKPVEGKVFFVAGVGDYASGTRRVRVELPNPMGRPSGEDATVVLVPSKSSKISPKPAPKVKVPAPTATTMPRSESSGKALPVVIKPSKSADMKTVIKK